jgi:colicin import membrane protein
MSNKVLLERAEREQREVDERKAERAAELKRLADEHDARMKREAAEQAKKDAAEQARRDAQFEAELEADARRLFEDGNPGAPKSLWESQRAEFRNLVIRRRAEAAANAPQHSLYKW